MSDKEKKILEEQVNTLMDENERLRKKIEILEAEKQTKDFPDITNIIDEKIESTFEKLLRERHGEPYRVELDDWSYRPSRTDKLEVGDWPPGPQIGDVPDGYPPYPYWPYGPYWSIYPPYWGWEVRSRRTYTNEGTTVGPIENYVHTTSKTEES